AHREIEVLHIVGAQLRDRNRIIEADRTERRSPYDARADRCTPVHSRIDDLVVTRELDLVAVEGGRIGKHRPAQTEALRNQRHRELRFRADVEVGFATQMIAGLFIDRTNAAIFEAADDAIAALEQIEGTRTVVAERSDVSGTRH